MPMFFSRWVKKLPTYVLRLVSPVITISPPRFRISVPSTICLSTYFLYEVKTFLVLSRVRICSMPSQSQLLALSGKTRFVREFRVQKLFEVPTLLEAT